MEDESARIRIVVDQVHVEGRGAILLTGPSSCGKGEVAKSLCHFLSLDADRHVSMGDVLRSTVDRARSDKRFRDMLGAQYGISAEISIFDSAHNPLDLVEKAQRYDADLTAERGSQITTSQLDWLAFCLGRGLLIPDDWAEGIIDAHFANTANLHEQIFILDGYPRTVVAAQKLLRAFSSGGIGIIKVLHLSITKEQMKTRAQSRSRSDDTTAALESRYQFYIEKVQPCIDYLKVELGPQKIALIDGHQPVFDSAGNLDIEKSIRAVTISVVEALGLPHYLLDLSSD